MPSRELQQYWTREAIESMKATFRWEAPVTVLKPARPEAETIDGGCQLYRLPVEGSRA